MYKRQLLVLDFSARDRLIEDRYLDVVGAVAASLVGETSDLAQLDDPTGVYVTDDGIIELSPLAALNCAPFSLRFVWSGPEAVIARCNSTPPTLMRFELDEARLAWIVPIPVGVTESAFENAEPNRVSSSELVAVVENLTQEANGLNPRRDLRRLHILGAETGELLGLHEFEIRGSDDIDDPTRQVEKLGVVAVGSDRVWLSTGNDLLIVELGAEQVRLLENSVPKVQFPIGPIWRGHILISNRTLETNTWYSIDTAQALYVSPAGIGTQDSCQLFVDVLDSQNRWVNLDENGKTRPIPDSALGGVPIPEGWIVIDGGVRHIAQDGAVQWSLERDVVREASFVEGRLYIENHAGEVFNLHLQDGTIASQLPQNVLPRPNSAGLPHPDSPWVLASEGRLLPVTELVGCPNLD